jgi:uncharacterized membrane protein YphA (DoxX/SURF4 family)
MGVIGVLASELLGAVFVVAGASKVASGPQWRAHAVGMGTPRWMIPLVPWWEMGVGALSIVSVWSPGPAIAALATLVVFTVAIAVQLVRGRHPQCACFGAWSAAPLGVRHVVRNVLFIGLAAVAALAG